MVTAEPLFATAIADLRARGVRLESPARASGNRKRRFVAGRAVLERVGRGARSIVRVAFALTPRARLDDRFDFLATARRVASEQFAKKAMEEFQRGVGLRHS